METQATGAASLLAHVGDHATARFAERISPLGLTRPRTGVMRAVAGAQGRSQQAVAAQLGMHPSRLVALVDDLERDGLLERRRNPIDRRHHALHLTEAGDVALDSLAMSADEHEEDLCSALSVAERIQLARLLRRIANQQGLTHGAAPQRGGQSAERRLAAPAA